MAAMLRTQLSLVPEASVVTDKLDFTVIGRNSFQLCGAVAGECDHLFPTLADKHGSHDAGMKKTASLNPTPSSGAEAFFDHAPFSCKFWVDGDEFEDVFAELSPEPLPSPRSEKDEYTSERGMDRHPSTTSNPDSGTPGTQRSRSKKSVSTVGSTLKQGFSIAGGLALGRAKLNRAPTTTSAMSEFPQRPVIKANYYPIENFSEEVQSCHTEEHFERSCVLFAIDDRNLEDPSELNGDLVFRKLEVQRWIQSTMKRYSLGNMPRMLCVTLVHEMPSTSGEGSLTQVLPGCTAPPSAKNPDACPGKYKTFSEELRTMIQAPQHDCIYYKCDFDDIHALLGFFVKLSSVILHKRTNDSRSFLETDPSSKSMKSSSCCCVVA